MILSGMHVLSPIRTWSPPDLESSFGRAVNIVRMDENSLFCTRGSESHLSFSSAVIDHHGKTRPTIQHQQG